jgi:hypothetical protein
MPTRAVGIHGEIIGSGTARMAASRKGLSHMKVSSNCKLEKVTEPSGTRGTLEHIRLDIVNDQAKLIACNGHAMAVLNVEADKSEVGYLPVKALQAARKLVKRGDVNIQLNGACELSDGSVLPRPKEDEGQYPDWQKVTPDKPVTLRLGINAKLLHDLSDALGAHNNYVSIELTAAPGERSQIGPMYVRATGVDGFGVIMPVRVDTDIK